MNIAETLRSLRRRWYIVVPGLILAVALAFGAWTTIKPGYERSATQLLLPGTDSVPEGGNPYIYIGGLTQAADVVVRGVGSRNVLEAVAEEYPGADVQVSRDASASGPLIVITVLAKSDAAAAGVIEDLVGRTATVLEELQDEENIVASNRIKVIPITVDEQSVLEQKNRVIAAAGVGIGMTVLTLLAAALIDGLIFSRKRRRGMEGVSRQKAKRAAKRDVLADRTSTDADDAASALDELSGSPDTEPVQVVVDPEVQTPPAESAGVGASGRDRSAPRGKR